MIELHVLGGPRDGDVIAVPGEPPLEYVFPVLLEPPSYHATGALPPLSVRRRICPIRRQHLFRRLPALATIERYHYVIDWYGGREVG